MREPSVPRMAAPTLTVNVVFTGSEPEGVKRRIRCASSRRPAAPSAAETETLPETAGLIVTRLSLTVCGSMGRSKTTTIGEVIAMPWVPSAGAMVRAVSPAETVRNESRSGAFSAVPAWSCAPAPRKSVYAWSGIRRGRGTIVRRWPAHRRSASVLGTISSARCTLAVSISVEKVS